MKLFLSSEAEPPAGEMLFSFFNQIYEKLDFVCNRNIRLEGKDNYGTEFREIAIICVIITKKLKDAGGTERRHISRKNKSADIRLYIDYEKFLFAPEPIRRLMYIKNIIDSIDVVIERSKGDFKGEKLKKDIFNALGVTQELIDKAGR